jgi:hypothetical protein
MNDERPIEKMLRRAAQKRNDEAGAPPELHPANRRMLQAEVARQFPPAKAPSREAAPPFWAALTRRWAYALALIPVIGIVALVVLPILSKPKSKGTMNLAQNAPQESAAMPAVMADESIAPASSPLAITAPPPAGLPLAGADRNASARREFSGGTAVATASLGANRENERLAYQYDSMPENAKKAAPAESFSRAVPATAAATAAPTRSAAVGGISGAAPGGAVAATSGRATGSKLEERSAADGSTFGKELDAASALAAKDNAGAVVAAGSTQEGYYSDKAWIARGGGAERQRAVLNSQAFSNLEATQAEAKRKDARANQLTPPVLINFKVEQAGRDLRVVDGDGSVYKGVVDEQNTLYKQISERQQQKLAIANDSQFKFQTPKQTEAISPAKQLDAETYYLYRVEGTNRTLNQNVVFTWNFVDTNALASGNLNYQNTAQKLDATKLPSQFPALLQNSYINGRAQFGEGREIEVNAVPVK